MREKNVFLNSSLGVYEYTSNTLKELTTQNFATYALQTPAMVNISCSCTYSTYVHNRVTVPVGSNLYCRVGIRLKLTDPDPVAPPSFRYILNNKKI